MSKERAWLQTPAATLWVCFTLNFLNYLDRTLPYSLAERLKGEFALGDADVGLLGSAFLVVFSVAAPLLGYLADRVERRKILAASAVVWSAATAASSLAPNYEVLLALRALVGVGEAGYTAAAPALLATHFEESRRPRAFAFFYIAIPVGSAAGYIAGGLLGGLLGWRGAFVAAALPALVLAPLALGLSERAPGVEAEEPEHRLPTRGDFRALLSNPVYWMLILCGAGVSFALGGVQVFFPAHLSRTFGYAEQLAGVGAGLAVALPSLFGTVLGGRIGEREGPKGRLLHAPTLGIAAGAVLAGVYFRLSNPWIAHPLIMAAIFAVFLYPGPLNSALANQVPKRLLATAFSLQIFLIHFLGDIWSAPLMGWLSDGLQRRGASPADALAGTLALAVPLPLLLGAVALAAAAALMRRRDSKRDASGRK